MKENQKILIGFALFTMLIVAMGLIESCGKQPIPETLSLDNPANVPITERILAFKQQLEYHRDNPGLKNGILFPADTAIWELESQLNFNFCYNNIEVIEKELSEFTITMPLNADSKIPFDDLVDLYYNKIIDSIQAKMQQISYPNMRLLLVDLEQTGTTSNGDALVGIGALIGNEQNITLHNGNWWYGKQMGLCGSGTHAPEDAASQLESKVIDNVLPEPPSGGRWYFIGIENTYINPTQDPLTNNPDNYLDYKIFYTSEAVGAIGYDEKCLSQFEMTFYKNHYIDYALAYENSTDKGFNTCVIEGTDYSSPVYHIQHNYWIFVGHRLVIMETSIEDIQSY